jgi:hypothetical protein
MKFSDVHLSSTLKGAESGDLDPLTMKKTTVSFLASTCYTLLLNLFLWNMNAISDHTITTTLKYHFYIKFHCKYIPYYKFCKFLKN